MPRKSISVLVIGGGSAGIGAALTARSLGASVILVEKELLGGECPNNACIPTKALLVTAKAYHEAKINHPQFGITATGLEFSFSKAMRYKDAVVNTVTGDGKKLERILKAEGVKYVKGFAEFVDANTVKVGNKKYRADKIIIATGVVDAVPPIDGIEKVPYLSYRDVVTLKRQPESIAVIGAGPVGVEFSTFFSMIGTRVNLFEIGEHILGYEDEEIALLAQKSLANGGVNISTGTKVLSVKKRGLKVEIIYQRGRQPRKKIVVNKLIVAAGKRSNVSRLKLENAGVKIDDRGKLILNKKLQTSKKHIYAAGDVSGGIQLTQTAHRDGEIVGYNAVSRSRKKLVDNRVVPRVTFGFPEVASVGVTAKEAGASGLKFEVRSFPVGALGRAVCENKRQGMLKVVLDAKSGRVLGAQMIGERAGEVIHELALVMHLNVSFDKIESMLHAFPTYSEAIAAL